MNAIQLSNRSAIILFTISLIFAFLLLFSSTAHSAPGGGKGGGGKGGGGKSSTPTMCNDHIDNDGDGYCDAAHPKSFCTDGSIVGDSKCSDRNDNSETCNPSPEVCDNIDNDCDGSVDEDNACFTEYFCDEDVDGHYSIIASGSCNSFECAPLGCQDFSGFDCMDSSPDVNPGVIENCSSDGFDNDCDGTVDECDTCLDGILNGNETDIDCGGSCQQCEINESCQLNADCVSDHCNNFVCANPPVALDPNCKPLKYDNSNNLDNHMNIVFVPSGFNGDMALFEQKAQWIFNIFQNYIPFKNDIERLNVFHVPVENGDLGCYFNCGGIERLLCCSTTEARNVSATCTSGPRQTVVVRNSSTYGGAGYRSADVATTSTHSLAPQIAIHELGHSAFNLGDEYNYQSSSTSSNSANCSESGCSKWADMIGYNGVSCINNSCGNGSYYTSETTMMKDLSYAFQEVNLRASCCAYYNETGSYPPYCNQFNQFASSENIDQFCFQGVSSSTSAAPVMFVHKPVMITFHKIGDDWVKVSEKSVRPGKHSVESIKGHPKGKVKIDITFSDDSSETLTFEDHVDVEVPGGDFLKMDGYVKVPRKVISVVVETKGNKIIKSIKEKKGK